MNVENITKIKSLRREAANIGGFHELFRTTYAVDTHCDKKGYGFNYDDRFTAFVTSVGFSSKAGYYGNSSCSSVLSVGDRPAVEKALVKALNIHQREIFATMARLMSEEAAALTDKAQQEISALQQMVEEAKGVLDAPADAGKAVAS